MPQVSKDSGISKDRRPSWVGPNGVFLLTGQVYYSIWGTLGLTSTEEILTMKEDLVWSLSIWGV